MNNPLAFDCRKCKAPAWSPCRYPDGRMTSHADREKRAKLCVFCGERTGDVRWSNSDGDAARGHVSFVCELCAVTKQLAHARERAKDIPALEKRLREISPNVTGRSGDDRK